MPRSRCKDKPSLLFGRWRDNDAQEQRSACLESRLLGFSCEGRACCWEMLKQFIAGNEGVDAQFNGWLAGSSVDSYSQPKLHVCSTMVYTVLQRLSTQAKGQKVEKCYKTGSVEFSYSFILLSCPLTPTSSGGSFDKQKQHSAAQIAGSLVEAPAIRGYACFSKMCCTDSGRLPPGSWPSRSVTDRLSNERMHDAPGENIVF